MLYIYTDGSTRQNGKAGSNGGFGVVVIDTPDFTIPEQNGRVIDVYSKMCAPTTNNREEMKAIIWALEKYGRFDNPVVYSDSSYSVNTFTKWMWGWKSNGWKKGDNKPPENLDLIQLYDILISKGYRINLQYIKGHVGKKWNEIADQLATGKITPDEVVKAYG